MMPWTTRLCLTLLTVLSSNIALAAIPLMIPYTGTVSVNGEAFEGTGQFKFAIVSQPCINQNEGCVSLWSNDESTGNGAEPEQAVALPVEGGRFSVKLGDADLTHMQPIPASVFQNDITYLRVWFNDGVTGFQLLSPDRQLVSVPYAYRAATVDELAPGQAVTRLNGLSDDITLSAGNNISIDQTGNSLTITAAGGEGATGVDCIQCVDTADLADNSVNDAKIADLSWQKLSGVPADLLDGDASYTDEQAVAAIKAADGPGSGLDADTLDGLEADSFITSLGGTIIGGLVNGSPDQGNLGPGSINTETLAINGKTVVPTFRSIAGDFIEIHHPGNVVMNLSYTKIAELRIPRSGTYRIVSRLQAFEGGGYGKLYKNGTPIGQENTSFGLSNVIDYVEDIEGWVTGDLIQLYVRSIYVDSSIKGELFILSDNPTNFAEKYIPLP